jgi:hypothetical protein
MASIKWIKASGIPIIILNIIINRKDSKAPYQLSYQCSLTLQKSEESIGTCLTSKEKVLRPGHNNRTWCH